jgi:hypothetical protein
MTYAVKFKKYSNHWLLDRATDYDKKFVMQLHDKIENIFPTVHIMGFVTGFEKKQYKLRIQFFTNEDEAQFMLMCSSGAFDEATY